MARTPNDRNKTLQDPIRQMIDSMPVNDAKRFLNLLENDVAQNTMGQRIGNVLGTAGNIFLQRAGVQMPQQKQENPIDQLIKLQSLQMKQQMDEQKLRMAEAKEQRESAKFEQDRILAQQQQQGEQELRGQIKGQKPVTTQQAVQKPSLTSQQIPQDKTIQQATQTPVNLQNIPEGEVRTKATIKTGGVTETYENPMQESLIKLSEEAQSAKLKEGREIQTGAGIAFNNLEKVAGSLNNVDRVISGSIIEGGAGSRLNEINYGIARQFGGNMLDKYENTTAREGVLNEALFNMIPMLTQQGDKPGSVRMVATVIEALGASLPKELRLGAKASRKMLETTLRSFYRFARAAEIRGLGFDENFSNVDSYEQLLEIDEKGKEKPNPQFQAWINKVKTAAARVKLSSGEEKALKELTNNALPNLTKLSGGEEGSYEQYLKDIGQ